MGCMRVNCERCGSEFGTYPSRIKKGAGRYCSPACRVASLTFDLPSPNPSGLCQCGCGRPTKIATRSSMQHGWVSGKPIKYIAGHARNGHPHIEYITEDHGWSSPCWIWQGRVNDKG